MNTAPDRPFVCPVLIGRAGELHSLSRLLRQTQEGKGQVTLVTGEAGIGKSRLVAEAKALAISHGLQVLQGNCFERDRSLPYSAVLEMLRSCFASRSREALEDFLGPLSAELVKLVPELSLVLPGLVATTPLEREQEKRRLFHTLARLLDQLAAKQPLLAVFEDLHWSDETTLQFLTYYTHYLADLSEHPVLVLMTYRSDEVDPVLAHFLAELDRQRVASEVVLTSLTMAESDVMVRAILNLGRPVRRDFLEALYQQTEGNPFYIEEILKSSVSVGAQLMDTGQDRKPEDILNIPRSVQDAVRQRAGRLSEGARGFLHLAAVAGQRFDFALMQALTGRDTMALLGQIRELLEAQLVVEESAERFAFRHALTRQAIYSNLLSRERRELHSTIGEAMERIYGVSPERLDRYLGDLAYHFYEAEAWEKALYYGQRAGEKAQELFTPRASVQHLSQALDAAARLAISPAPRLLQLRARAYETLGDFERSLVDQQAALESARSASNDQEEWQALLGLGMIWAARDYTKTGEYYQQALDLAQSMGDQKTLAHSLNRVGNWRLNVEQPREALQYHEQALEQVKDRVGLAETLDLLGMTWMLGGDLVKSRGYYERAVALFEELDDRQGLVSSLATMAVCAGFYHTDTMAPAAALAEGAGWAERALQLAANIGWRSGECYALWNLGMCLGVQGEYQRAFDYALQGRAIAEEIGHTQWLSASLLTLGCIYLDLLDFMEGRSYLEQAFGLAKTTGSLHWTRTAAGCLASSYVRQKQFALAQQLLDEVLDPHEPAQTIGQRKVWTARVELALARGQGNEALQLLDLLIDDTSDGQRSSIPLLWKLRADALTMLNYFVEAEEMYRSAREGARRQGAHALLWRIHAALAVLYRKTARRAEAAIEAQAARRLVEEIAGNVPQDGLRHRFLRGALSLLPTLPARSPRQAVKEAFSGLTEREREVTVLISTGRSNAEIAEMLVISERTVETHVTHIMTKLGFTSRAQIAAWAAEKGLRPSS